MPLDDQNIKLPEGYDEPKANVNKAPTFDQIAQMAPVEFAPEDWARDKYFSTDINAQEVGRFLTYGSDIYGKFGFDPYRDNNKFYNDHTDSSVDLGRAWDGMWALASVGFKDTFGFGAFGEEDNYKDFGQIMEDYSSTRRNPDGSSTWTGFFSNAMVSAGYTVGIVGAIAVEEFALAGITLATGGLGAPLTGTAAAATVGRGMYNLRKLWAFGDKVGDTVNVFQKMRNIETARKFYDPRRWMVGGAHFIGNWGKALRPLGNTGDFIRSMDKFNTTNFNRAFQGAAAFARDSRKYYLAHSESRLEANFVKDELMEESMNQWFMDNPGQEMDTETYNDILDRGLQAYEKAYAANLAVIYATNGLLFEGLFKGMNPLRAATNYKNGLRFIGKGSQFTEVEAVEQMGKEYFKNIARSYNPFRLQNWLKAPRHLGSASMEGVQEVVQDIIHDSAMRYVGFSKSPFSGRVTLHDWDSDRRFLQGWGDYFTNLYEARGASSWETFMTGMLIGPFAGVANVTTQVASDMLLGNVVSVTKEGRKKAKKDFKERQKIAEFLTIYFEQTGGIVKHLDKRANIQLSKNAMENMIEAARRGDKKFLEDNRGQIFRLGTETMLEHGLINELRSHLRSLHNHSVEELNEFIGDKEVEEDTKADYLTKVDDMLERIDNIEKEYKRVQRDVINEGAFFQRAKTPEESKINNARFYAGKALQREMVWNSDRILELKQRYQRVMNATSEGNFLTREELNPLLSSQGAEAHLENLKTQIESNKEYKINEAETRNLEKKYNALKAYADTLKQFENATEETDVEALREELKTSFKEYSSIVGTDIGYDYYQNLTVQNLDKKFDTFYDALQLQNDLSYYSEFAKTLIDPKFQSQFIEEEYKINMQIEEDKRENIERSLEEAWKKKASDAALGELLDNGMFFDLTQVDDLFDKGIMPSKIYDLDTKEEVSDEKHRKAIEILNKHYKRLTGKKIVGTKESFIRSIFVNTTKRLVKDKRRFKTLVNTYAKGRKLDNPMGIQDLIKKLKSKGSQYLTSQDLEIIEMLEGLNLEGKVVLTDTGERAIDFLEDGTLVIDVRFASEDFQQENKYSDEELEVMLDLAVQQYQEENPKEEGYTETEIEDLKEAYKESLNLSNIVSFEYLAISGILTKVYADAMEKNPAFVKKVEALMDAVVKATAEDTGAEEPYVRTRTEELLSPVAFLREALSNIDFQLFLRDIEFKVKGEERNIWGSLESILQAQGIGDLKGTSLDHALYLARIAMSDLYMEVVSETEETKEEGKETPTEEGEEEPVKTEEETVEQKRARLVDEIKAQENLQKKLNRERNLAHWIKKRGLKKKIEASKELVKKLRSELNDTYPVDTSKDAPVSPATEPAVTNDDVKEDVTGKAVVNSKTKLKDMDPELMFQLAVEYLRVYKPVRLERNFDLDATEALDVDASGLIPFTKKNYDQILSLLNNSDLEFIQNNLTKPTFYKFIQRWNKTDQADEGTTGKGPAAPAVDEARDKRLAELIAPQFMGPATVMPSEIFNEEDLAYYEENKDRIDALAMQIAEDSVDEEKPNFFDDITVTSLRALFDNKLSDPLIADLYSDEDLQEQIDLINAAETEEDKMEILAQLENSINTDLENARKDDDQGDDQGEEEISIEGLTEYKLQLAKVVGVKNGKLNIPVTEIKVGDRFRLEIERAKEGEKLFGKYDVAIRIVRPDGTVIGWVKANSPEEKAIMESLNPDNAIVEMTYVNPGDTAGNYTGGAFKLYLDGPAEASEIEQMKEELAELLETYDWWYKIAPTLLNQNEGEKESRIKELILKLGPEGVTMYQEALEKEAAQNNRPEQAKAMIDISEPVDEKVWEKLSRKKDLTLREKNGRDKIKELSSDPTNTGVIVWRALAQLRAKDVAFADVLGIYNMRLTAPFTKIQKTELFNAAIDKLRYDPQLPVGQWIRLTNGRIYQVLDRGITGKDVVVSSETHGTEAWTFEELLANTSEILEEGTEVGGGQVVAFNLTNQDVRDLRGSYTDIFSNLADNVKDFDKVSDTDLAKSIIDKFNEC